MHSASCLCILTKLKISHTHTHARTHARARARTHTWAAYKVNKQGFNMVHCDCGTVSLQFQKSDVFCVQNLYTFCAHFMLYICEQFTSCTVINYWTHNQHSYHIRSQWTSRRWKPQYWWLQSAPHITEPWSTGRTTVVIYKTPLMSQSILLRACRLCICTKQFFFFEVPNKQLWTNMYLRNYKHLKKFNFLIIMT
jgi:hypothetical protein